MEDFVTYDIAVKLKEKGFNERCLAYYTKDSDFFYNTSYGLEVEYAFKSFNSRPNHICGKRIDAPTISQVLKWLREDKGVHIISTLWNSGWYVDIQSFTKEEDEEGVVYEVGYIFQSPDYETYEKAALAGIEYVINNLI
jgi:hypothetical protein